MNYQSNRKWYILSCNFVHIHVCSIVSITLNPSTSWKAHFSRFFGNRLFPLNNFVSKIACHQQIAYFFPRNITKHLLKWDNWNDKLIKKYPNEMVILSNFFAAFYYGENKIYWWSVCSSFGIVLFFSIRNGDVKQYRIEKIRISKKQQVN